MSKFALCITLATLLSVSAFAQESSPSSGLTANPVYQKNCARCHGENAKGRHFRGPALASEKVAKASPEELHKIITDGKGHMPKFGSKLSADDIDALVKQVEALNKK